MLDRPGLKPTFSQFVLTETANKNQKERLLSNDYIWIHFYYLYIRGMIDNTTTYNYKTRHCIAIRKKMRDNCDGGSGNTKFETKMQMLFSIQTYNQQILTCPFSTFCHYTQVHIC